jgi:hypothetical protein
VVDAVAGLPGVRIIIDGAGVNDRPDDVVLDDEGVCWPLLRRNRTASRPRANAPPAKTIG